MIEPMFQGRRILVVEDEYFLADELSTVLTEAGAEVLGPVPSIEEASAIIRGDERIDAALLDVNLRGEPIFSVADELRAQHVPFVFATGYDQLALPERFAGAIRIEKPVRPRAVIVALAPLLANSRLPKA